MSLSQPPPLNSTDFVLDHSRPSGWDRVKNFLIEYGFALLLSFFFFGLTVLAFFPGEMTADTFDQLTQASIGVFLDGHPPVMAAFWRFLFWFWKDPGILFLFHNICIWGFLGILAVTLSKNRLIQGAILALSVLPPLWCQWIVVWKDTELSICLLGAYLFLVLAKRADEQEGEWSRLFFCGWMAMGVLLVIYSMAVRFNSLPALIPLTFFLFKKKGEKIHSPRVFLWVLPFLAAVYLAVQFFNYGLLKATKYYVSQALKIQDIVSIYVQTGRDDLIPAYWRTLDPQLDLGKLQKDNEAEDLYSSTGQLPVRTSHDPAQLAELDSKWKNDILQFPSIYLRHRWTVFKYLFRIGESDSYFPFQITMSSNRFGITETGDRDIRIAMKHYFWEFGNSFLFKGWFYLGVLFCVLGWEWFGRGAWTFEKEASFYSALSALLYALGYFIYAPAFDFRLLYPTVTLTFFSLVTLLVSRQKGPPQ